MYAALAGSTPRSWVVLVRRTGKRGDNRGRNPGARERELRLNRRRTSWKLGRIGDGVVAWGTL